MSLSKDVIFNFLPFVFSGLRMNTFVMHASLHVRAQEDADASVDALAHEESAWLF